MIFFQILKKNLEGAPPRGFPPQTIELDRGEYQGGLQFVIYKHNTLAIEHLLIRRQDLRDKGPNSTVPRKSSRF